MVAEGREIDAVFKMMEGAQGEDALGAAAIERARGLPIWSGEVEPRLLSGGLSNINLTVEDRDECFVVKVGEDEDHIGVVRANELKAMKAAYDGWWQETRPLMVNEGVPMSPTRPFHVLFNKQQNETGIPKWNAPKL